MKKRKLLLIGLLAFGGVALAFCGFYVAKADTELFNETSKVVIAKDGPRTILTMANDFSGDVEDFAIVVPVPYHSHSGADSGGRFEHVGALGRLQRAQTRRVF